VSGFLTRLGAQAVGVAPVVKPRRAARFEPPAGPVGDSGAASIEQDSEPPETTASGTGAPPLTQNVEDPRASSPAGRPALLPPTPAPSNALNGVLPPPPSMAVRPSVRAAVAQTGLVRPRRTPSPPMTPAASSPAVPSTAAPVAAERPRTPVAGPRHAPAEVRAPAPPPARGVERPAAGAAPGRAPSPRRGRRRSDLEQLRSEPRDETAVYEAPVPAPEPRARGAAERIQAPSPVPPPAAAAVSRDTPVEPAKEKGPAPPRGLDRRSVPVLPQPPVAQAAVAAEPATAPAPVVEVHIGRIDVVAAAPAAPPARAAAARAIAMPTLAEYLANPRRR
jgi:hypothetical protein